MTNKSRESSIDVSYFQDTPGFALCAFGWSPDNHYVSFVTGCSSLYSPTKEVYVWDVIQAQVAQVTSFTIAASKRKIPNNFIIGKYELFWFDAQTLLIGAIFSDDIVGVNTQTLLYQVSDKTTSILASGTVESWTENPVSGELAYRSIPAIANISGFRAQSSVVHVGNLSRKALQIVISDPSANGLGGCNLSWSPDGAVLGYTIRGESCTVDKVQGIGFINKTSRKIERRMLSEAEFANIQFVYQLGWLATK